MKIMFTGTRDFLEPDMPQRIDNALRQLAGQNKPLELYFSDNSVLAAQCLIQSAIFRARHPKTSISLIRVRNYHDAAQSPDYKDYFLQPMNGPKIKFDQTLIFPPPKVIPPETPNAYSQRFYQTQRQTADLCDCMVCYNYFELYDPANTLVRRQMNKRKKQFITMANPLTALWLSQQYSQLPERQCFIMNRLNEGETLSSIAKTMNISLERVRQMAAKATHNLIQLLKAHWRENEQPFNETGLLD